MAKALQKFSELKIGAFREEKLVLVHFAHYLSLYPPSTRARLQKLFYAIDDWWFVPRTDYHYSLQEKRVHKALLMFACSGTLPQYFHQANTLCIQFIESESSKTQEDCS